MAMFSRSEPADLKHLTRLREACERNARVEIIPVRSVGKSPMARGRLLRLLETGLEIGGLSVVGRNHDIVKSTEVFGFFVLNDQLYRLMTVVVDAKSPVRLNNRWRVPGVTTSWPSEISIAQRRNRYRVSLAHLDHRINAELWRQDELEKPNPEGSVSHDTQHILELGDVDDSVLDLLPEGGKPSTFNYACIDTDEPGATGFASDLAELGMNVLLPERPAPVIKRFDPLVMRFALPDSTSPLVIGCEARRVSELPDGRVKIGMLFQDATEENLAVIANFVRDMQRDQLRRNTVSRVA